MTTILVIGGAGYIGDHTCVELLIAGYNVVVADSLYNSNERALEKIKKITGRKVKFYKTNLLGQSALKEMFGKEKIDLVTHFAGLKAAGESVCKPLEYYHNNTTGTLILCGEMRNHGVKNIVFGSSATVYEDPAKIPITGSYLRGEIANPYGRTKDMLEQVSTDLYTANPKWNVALLCHFNPIGAHENGLIGEDPRGIPNNLVPYIAQVTVGKLDRLNVLGGDYDMPDGTGVRDYIHVVDLTGGHVRAVQKLWDKEDVSIYNLGAGVSCSVLDMLHAYEEACDRTLKCEIQPRHEGGMATCYSDSAEVKCELGWMAKRGIKEMCADPWKWQSTNSNGYRG